MKQHTPTEEKHRDVLKSSLKTALRLAREQDGLTLEEIALEMAGVLDKEELEALCRTWAVSI